MSEIMNSTAHSLPQSPLEITVLVLPVLSPLLGGPTYFRLHWTVSLVLGNGLGEKRKKKLKISNNE